MFLRDWFAIGIFFHLLLSGVTGTDNCDHSSRGYTKVGIYLAVIVPMEPTTCSCLINSSTDGVYCLSFAITVTKNISSCQCFWPKSNSTKCSTRTDVNCKCCSFCGPGKSSNLTFWVSSSGDVGDSHVTCVETSNLQSSTIAQKTSTSFSPGTTKQSTSTISTTVSVTTSTTSSNYNISSITSMNLAPSPDKNNQNRVIIGSVVGVVGGLILIAVIVVVAIVFYRRRHKSLSNSNRTLANSTSTADRKFNDYDRPNRVVSILPMPFTQLDISPNEQSVNPPPFNPNEDPNSYDNNNPIVSPAMSHGDTNENETNVEDNQFYASNPSETVTMATDHEADDTTLVENQFYAGNPSETVTMATGDTTVVDNSFYGRSPVDTTTTEYYNVGRRS